jgi:glycosyltransferase involved in cell wall biosynthesis
MTPPKKLLMIARSLFRNGGIETHVIESAQTLHEAGYDVCIVAAELPHDYESSEYRVVGVPHLDAQKMPGTAQHELLSTIANFKPDIIHVHQLFDTKCVRLFRNAAPLVWSIHNYNAICVTHEKYFGPGVECMKAYGPGCMSNMLLRGCDHRKVKRPSPLLYLSTGRLLKAVRQADIAVAYSHFVCDQLKLNAVERVAQVPIFTTPPDEYPVRPRRRRVMFSGRIVREKGLDTLLRALALVPDAMLDICGDGYATARSQKLARSLGIEERVRFHGWCTTAELESFYIDTDVVVVPSIWPEPFGIVGLEAMRHARPVIASAIGGIPDWLTDGRTGLLVAPGDATALRDAMTWMLDHPAEADEMGRRGAEDVVTYFSPAAFVEASGRAYEAAQAHWLESMKSSHVT